MRMLLALLCFISAERIVQGYGGNHGGDDDHDKVVFPDDKDTGDFNAVLYLSLKIILKKLYISAMRLVTLKCVSDL